MPPDYLYPPQPGVNACLPLTEDAVIGISMLGSVLVLNGHELTLEALDGYGVVFLVGPGSVSGLLAGEFGEGEGAVLALAGGEFAWANAAVQSVAGRTGAITLTMADIGGLITALAEKASAADLAALNAVVAGKANGSDLAAALATKLAASLLTSSTLDAAAAKIPLGSDTRLNAWEKACVVIAGSLIAEAAVPGPRGATCSLRFQQTLSSGASPTVALVGGVQAVVSVATDAATISLTDLLNLVNGSPSVASILTLRTSSLPGSPPPEVSTAPRTLSLTGGKLPLAAVKGLEAELDSKQAAGVSLPLPLEGIPVNDVLNLVVTSSGGLTPDRAGSYPVLPETSHKKYAAGDIAPGFVWIVGGSSFWALCSNVSTLTGAYWKSPSAGPGVSAPVPARPDQVSSWTAVGGASGSFTVAADYLGGTGGIPGQESIDGLDVYKCVNASPATWVQLATAPLP